MKLISCEIPLIRAEGLPESSKGILVDDSYNIMECLIYPGISNNDLLGLKGKLLYINSWKNSENKTVKSAPLIVRESLKKMIERISKYRDAGIFVFKIKLGHLSNDENIELFNFLHHFKGLKYRLDLNSFELNNIEKLMKLEHLDFFETSDLKQFNYLHKKNIPVAFDLRNVNSLPKEFETLVIKPQVFATKDELKAFCHLHSEKRIILSNCYEGPWALRNYQDFAAEINPNDYHGLGTLDLFWFDSKEIYQRSFFSNYIIKKFSLKRNKSNEIITLINPDINQLEIAWKKVIQNGAKIFIAPPDQHLDIDFYRRKIENYDERLLGIDEAKVFMLTSGSSGKSKIIAHSLLSIFASAYGTNCYFKDAKVWGLNLPLYHMAGFMTFIRAYLLKTRVIDLSEGEYKLSKNYFDIISLVPTQLKRYLENDQIDLLNPPRILLGGGYCSQSIINDAISKGIRIYQGLGMTETATHLTLGKLCIDKNHCGKEIRFRNTSVDNDLLVASGLTICRAIFENEIWIDRIKEIKTDDNIEFDCDGNFIYLGRKDKIFNSGGEKVDPYLIKKYLNSIAEILDSEVLPFENTEYGHVAHAFVKSNAILEASSIRSFLKSKLPGYMIPKKYYLLNDDSEMKLNKKAIYKAIAENRCVEL